MKNGKLACLHRTESTGDLIREGKLAIGDGYRAKNRELSDEGIPFARAGNIDSGFHFEGADRFPSDELEKVGEKVSAPGDVVFTSKGTVGRFAYVRETTPRFVYSPQLCYWRSLDPDVIDSRWLFYWMQGGEFWLQVSGLKGQTDMADYVSLRDQRQMDITLPPIEEQRRIASILGSLDDKIEHNRRRAQALERLARAIFKAWFVDFEPVRAKAEGATSFPSMPQDVFDALPTTFVDTETGPVPDGWEIGVLGDVFALGIGGQWGSDVETDQESYPARCLRGIDCHELATGSRPNIPLRWLKPSLAARRRLEDAVVLVEGSGSNCGRSLLWRESLASLYEDDVLYSNFTKRLDPLRGASHAVVAWYQLKAAYDGGTVAQYRTGSAFPNLDIMDMLKSFPIVIPDEKSASAFSDFVASFSGPHTIAENMKLAAMRDYLLPRLLSGSVELEGANGG